jgi:hypothetical protein
MTKRVQKSHVKEIAEADDGRSIGKSVAAVVNCLAKRPPFFPHVLVGFFTFYFIYFSQKK